VLRIAIFGIAVAVLACSGRKPPGGAPAAPVPASGAAADTPPPEVEEVVPGASAARLSPLVPYLAQSAWTKKGPPPTDYSIFAVRDGSPAPGYAVLDQDTCEAELRARHIDFARAEATLGVRAPVRLNGPLHGVAIHSWLPPAARARSRDDLIDCRLALSLDDFAASIAERGIVEVRTLSAYRTRAQSGCTRKYDGEQHCAALAVDVGSFKRSDGTVLNVERDFHGRIGTLTCRGESHPAPATPAAKELWDIACAAAGREFLVVLTPNWNAQHKNHMHLELTTHDWVLVR
jgi:hypothetical protein